MKPAKPDPGPMRLEVPAARPRVKALGAAACVVLTLAVLSGCASGWVNPQRTAAERRADEDACGRDAEENALARSGRQRSDYGGSAGPLPGRSATTASDIVDRSRTVRDFDHDLESCMEAKGYSRGDKS